MEFLALRVMRGRLAAPPTLHSAQVVRGLGVAWAVIRARHERVLEDPDVSDRTQAAVVAVRRGLLH